MSYKQKGQSKTKYVKKYKYHASLVLNITLFIVLSISVLHRLAYAKQFEWGQPDHTFEIKVQEVEVKVYETPKTVEEKIKAVFGDHADKAFQLLTCENRSLDPRATNYNPGSIDRGIFQINDKWQGFKHQGKADQFLYDEDININIAWRLYEDSGYNFNLWTCGKNMGI